MKSQPDFRRHLIEEDASHRCSPLGPDMRDAGHKWVSYIVIVMANMERSVVPANEVVKSPDGRKNYRHQTEYHDASVITCHHRNGKQNDIIVSL